MHANDIIMHGYTSGEQLDLKLQCLQKLSLLTQVFFEVFESYLHVPILLFWSLMIAAIEEICQMRKVPALCNSNQFALDL